MEAINIPVLMATPRPAPTESFRGYTLRLSEANGLLTPATMLGLAGMDHLDIRLARHPVEVIAGLAGMEGATLRGLTYSDDNVSGDTRLLGHPLSLAYLSLRDARICPECIQEHAFIPARWDLVSYTVCHIHTKQLVSSCPACGQKIKWLRPGLRTCTCGGDLAKAVVDGVNHPVTDLANAMNAVLERKPLENSESGFGMPFNEMSHMSLQTLMGVAHALAAHSIQLNEGSGRTKALLDPVKEIHVAAEILADWPRNFLELMKLDMRAGSSKSTSLRIRHRQLYARLFNMGYPESELKIFRDAMILHANNHPEIYVVDPRLASKASIAPAVTAAKNGLYGAARKAGVMPSTMRRWVRSGKIELLQGATGSKAMINQNSIDQLLPIADESLGEREAAAFIGLPVSVLKYLREQGVYEEKFRTVLPGAFAVADLEAMVSRFTAMALPKSDDAQAPMVSIASLMRRKFRSETIKAKLLQAIYTGDLKPYGSAVAIGEILVPSDDVSRLADKLMADESGMYTVRQAAEVIGCDIFTIAGMMALRMLEHQQLNGVKYLDRKAVDFFAEEYIPLSKLLQPHGYSSARGGRLCVRHGIPVLSVPRDPGNKIQPFIRRPEAEKLLGLMRAS